MRDVLFLAIVVVFFAIAAAYVRACAGLIGPDELVATDVPETDELEAEFGTVRPELGAVRPELGAGER